MGAISTPAECGHMGAISTPLSGWSGGEFAPSGGGGFRPTLGVISPPGF